MGLPDLLYISDVAVESTLAGELLLYRLLRRYPSDQLTIAQSNVGRSNPEKRLPDVEYVDYEFAYPRLLNSRLTEWYGSWLHYKAQWIPPTLKRVVDDVKPDAILTVWHDYSWLTAAEVARNRGIPLHLILHDDAPNLEFRAHPLFEEPHQRDFERVYQQADSRLCVSLGMEREYNDRYGVSGSVLYPARGWEASGYDAPPDRIGEKEKVRVGYAGSLHAPGFKERLGRVAEAIAPAEGEVLVYSNASPEKVRGEEWVKENTVLKGFVDPEDIVDELRNEVDLLFAASSFEGTV